METLANFWVFFFGACIGSFLNVVIYRIPAKISLLWPPSRCPQCHHKLGKTENVPVLGWLWLKGRCRWCKTSISPRYPLVEGATGILFLLVWWQFSFSLETLGYWALLSYLVALALIDLDTMTLPNPLTKSGLIVALVWQILRGWQTYQLPGAINFGMMGVFGAVLGLWLFEAIMIIGLLLLGQVAMGGGDPKLAAMLGAWLGWKYVLLTGFLACVLGAFVGGGAIALGLISRRQPVPFGPFLALAAIIVVFSGEGILSTYVKIFFPFS